MSIDREREGFAEDDYYYRRPLDGRDVLPAVGVGIAVGLAGFYIARLFLQRTPLERERGIPVIGARGTEVRRPLRPTRPERPSPPGARA